MRDTNTNSHSDSHTYADGDANSHSYSHTYADSDANSHAYADGNADCHSYGYSYCHSYSHGNGDCASSVANPDYHAQTYTHAQARADASSAGALIGTVKAGTREQNLASSP